MILFCLTAILWAGGALLSDVPAVEASEWKPIIDTNRKFVAGMAAGFFVSMLVNENFVEKPKSQ